MLFMGKSFRSDDLNQSLLLPPSLHDWLPENHLARFLIDVVETLDLSAILASCDAGDGRGQSACAVSGDLVGAAPNSIGLDLYGVFPVRNAV
jgi:hypothetical protein